MGGFAVGSGAEVGVAAGVTVGADAAGALAVAGDDSIVGSRAFDEHASGPNKANARRLVSKILLVATDGLRGVRFGPVCFGPLTGNYYWP